MWRSNRTGFTLIELMIGLLLGVIIAISLAHLFQNGLRLWKRMEKITSLQQEARGVLGQIARDVRQEMDVPGIGWTVANNRVSFATLSQAVSTQPPYAPTQNILKVTYQSESGRLQRQSQTLSPQQIGDPVTTTLTQHPASLRWEYAYASSEGPLEWLDRWSAESNTPMPCGVRVQLTLTDESAESETFTKTIFVPVTKPLPWTS